MKFEDRILVLGARGLVGSAIVKELSTRGYKNVLSPNKTELDLLDQKTTCEYFDKTKPNHVFLAAAKVGGIQANNIYRADFIFQNLGIQQNVFKASFDSNIDKLLFLGSTCVYPKMAPQPLKEEYLLTGPLEETNEPYAIAKIAGIKTAESFRRQYNKNYISVMPTNLFGENDNFSVENSHVIPGLIARMQKAIDDGLEEFSIWGTGRPCREFLYVKDMASACVHIMEYEGELPYLINIGCGKDISIGDLAKKVASLMGFRGKLTFDTAKPDGTPKKLVDISKLKDLGWEPGYSLDEGLERVVKYFKENRESLRT